MAEHTVLCGLLVAPTVAIRDVKSAMTGFVCQCSLLNFSFELRFIITACVRIELGSILRVQRILQRKVCHFGGQNLLCKIVMNRSGGMRHFPKHKAI